MKQLVHGGDWMGYRERFGRDAPDFSANVSPLGLPEGVAQAIPGCTASGRPLPRPPLPHPAGGAEPGRGCAAGAYPLAARRGRTVIFRLVWAVKPIRRW